MGATRPTPVSPPRGCARSPARESGCQRGWAGTAARVRDRSRAVGKRLRTISRTLRRRTGQAKDEVLALTGQTGGLLAVSVKEARAVAAAARATALALHRSGK